MKFSIETEREQDGRWIAEVPDLPGVITYGDSREDAITRVQALAENLFTPQDPSGAIGCWPPFVTSPFDNRNIGPRMEARINRAEKRAWAEKGILPPDDQR
jgi:hypothetical protein